MTKQGGMVPAELSDHHVKVCDKVFDEAILKANISVNDISLVAYSRSPGQGHALRIGAFFARLISAKLGLPIVGVNHCIAHMAIGELMTKCTDPVMLYASGANTQIIAYEGSCYRVFGETLDQGVGNFLDSFARYIGLGFPGGPKIYELALKGTRLIELPYTVKGMDMSFGGLLTNIKQKYDSKLYKVEDLCYSMQETVFAMLLEVSERAMAHCDKDELLLAGGVACNKRLQEMAGIMCKQRKAKLFVPEPQFLLDNAAMIAWLGIVMHKAGYKMKKADFDAYERIDHVKVFWK